MPSEISEVTPGDRDSAIKGELNPSFVSRSTMGKASQIEIKEME